MKIDSVIVMEVKTRKEELEELLCPDGPLNAAVNDAVRNVVSVERDSLDADAVDAAYETLDRAINNYMQYAIELDRIKRK